jgi:TDG/mug DNA glycosylase family protein
VPAPARRRFTRAELESFRDAEVPDLLPASGVKLLFVGINPGLWTAATRTHFAHPVNRFYPALLAAGIIEQPIDPAAGMTDADRERLTSRGIGITNVVRRATARADELTDDELRAGAGPLARLVRRVRPAYVAFLGVSTYRVAYDRRRARVGPQDDHAIGPARVWVLPNPSGLNAHYQLPDLVAAYGELRTAAFG